MPNIRVGDADVNPEDPAHTPGVHQGNSEGNYLKQKGHLPDGRSSARRSTGVNADAMEPIDPQMPNLSPG